MVKHKARGAKERHFGGQLVTHGYATDLFAPPGNARAYGTSWTDSV